MFAKTYGATTLGIDGRMIDVEVDVSPGLPGFELVGLPDTSVKESKERVRTAIRNSGIQLRQERVTVNLAPADVRRTVRGLICRSPSVSLYRMAWFLRRRCRVHSSLRNFLSTETAVRSLEFSALTMFAAVHTMIVEQG